MNSDNVLAIICLLIIIGGAIFMIGSSLLKLSKKIKAKIHLFLKERQYKIAKIFFVITLLSAFFGSAFKDTMSSFNEINLIICIVSLPVLIFFSFKKFA